MSQRLQVKGRLFVKFWFVAVLMFYSAFSMPIFSLTAVDIEYYGEIGCSHCDTFRQRLLPRIEAETGVDVRAEYYDILSEDGFTRCKERLTEMGQHFDIFPVLIIGNNAYQGNNAVESGLLRELSFFAKHGDYLKRQKKLHIHRESYSQQFTWLPVFFAGLADGVNPCAFTTMLFFLSWIASRGGGRRKLMLSGGSFITGIFLSYLAIGGGLFTLFRTAEGLVILREGLRYGFSILAFLLALLSCLDAVMVRRGTRSRMILQLPRSIKLLIHAHVRKYDGKESASRPACFSLLLRIVLPLVVTGMIVSLLELACTGQVYFPTIAFMVQSKNKAALPLLLLYNVAFIAPLILLLFLVVAGVSHQRIVGWFNRNLFWGKLGLALLFFVLALLLFLAP